ncbi:MAG TPA: ATP-binding protein [Candidatus Polarisedimenticolaceae bacterium]|nr:ATP-binding protein [Candidatus Polarisedimenticolaceae bacterium]
MSHPRGSSKQRRKTSRAAGELRGKLRPHDPFELIRWLALSQPDPRKALAELVQNSLDADAHRIRITRKRERGTPCLRILDDGAGVIPELNRPDALKYIATHIGHSRKRSLSPQERLQLMTQGQYGIGLLGFWSLGELLEIRSSVPDQRPHRLVLHRDRPDYRIEPLRGNLALDERFTEVVVAGLHREALGALIGRRAADYLKSELRGQLLARAVDLVVEDRMSRGRAQRILTVKPQRFLGERLEGLGPIDVPGHAPIRLEVYVAGEGGDPENGRLSLYSAGTLVAEDFHAMAPLGLDRPPWTDPRLTGIVDFPSFRVAPGSRRGVVLDEAAGAFAAALSAVDTVLLGVLDAIERRRAEELDRSIVRDLQRAFRDFHRHRPRYSMLPVAERPGPAAGTSPGKADDGGGGAVAAESPSPLAPSQSSGRSPREPAVDLLPPGPLDGVRVSPANMLVECRGSREARAQAVDAVGRPIEDTVEFRWLVVPAMLGALEVGTGGSTAESRARLAAGEHEGSGTLEVTAVSGERRAQATIGIEVVDEIPGGRGDEGIPEPELVDLPGAGWRSRMHDGLWQVNSGHRDFRAAAASPVLKLRYLAMLFSKEVVLRSHQDPRLDQPLEQLVEVAAYADRKLLRKGRRKKG